MVDSAKSHFCSFCGKEKDLVKKLIVSESAAICNECVTLCQSLLQDGPDASLPVEHDKMDPRTLKAYLDQWVIGQDQAKTVLSVAIVNHYKRLNCQDSDREISKANILMLGPTGSGKTLLAKTVARYLDVPFAIADATSLTEAGYVGDDVETLISRLYAASGNDLKKTQRGIIFIDEIDKIARKSESTSITRDVSGDGVQQALLKIVEGTVCRISPASNRKHPASEVVEVDTSNILFIAGGAFGGMEDIIKNRKHGSAIGFQSSITSKADVDLSESVPDDLVRFGLIPEFVGRFPSVVSLTALGKTDLVKILTQVKNNYVDQYKWLFEQDDVVLDFDPETLDILADRALSSGTGARALHSEIERLLMPHMFYLRDYRDRNINHIRLDPLDINNPSPR